MLRRKSLNKGVLLYVHLNLAIALLIALVIFVSGIETGTPVPVSTVHTCIYTGKESLMLAVASLLSYSRF